MKSLFTLCIVALSFSVLQAQNADTKKADKHFNRLEFVDAIEDYEKLIANGKSSDYVYHQLAKATYNIYDTKASERYYAKVVAQDNASAESHFRYAQMLKANGKYDMSNDWMAKFAQAAPNDARAKAFKANPDYLQKLLDSSDKFTLKPMSLNSSYSDFGGTIYGDMMYFVSARNEARSNYGWNEQPTLDIYQAAKEGDSYSNPTPVKGDVNTKYNEGSVAISKDGNFMYFTRNEFLDGKYGKDDNGIGQLQLYYAEKVNGEWKDVKSVPFNNSEYSVGHPTLSADGETLYFVSDMPGGQGESDLYRVSVNDGNFSTPENLGTSINTPGRESFPYVDKDNTLYFSSTGHLGLGGLDVFYAPMKNGQFQQPKNIGKPVNSTGDDYAFTLTLDDSKGFVSSNRDKGLVDNIYEVNQIEPLCEVMIAVTVVDSKANAPMAGARVDVYNGDTKVNSQMTDSNGMTSFKVACDIAYSVQAHADDYESNAVTTAKASNETIKSKIALNPVEKAIVTEDRVILNPILFEYDKSDIRPQAAFELDKLVNVMNEYPNMVIFVQSHTDNRGGADYNMQLSERRSQSTVQYVVSKGVNASRISGKGFGESNPAVDCENNCTDEEHLLNRRSEFVIVAK